MTSAYDLHCHSTASDGALTPTQLVEAAHAAGVRTLALTDHDTTAGLAEAGRAAASLDVRLIPAIELSATWSDKCFHIVGLDIDRSYDPLRAGIEKLARIRTERAREIGRRLEKKGVEAALEGALALAGDGMITRTHFAQHLVRSGRCGGLQEAFDRFLARGKPAYVSTTWAAMEEVVGWIRGAGGIAVLAHPMRYNLSGSWIRRALTAFKEAGGEGIEVVSGRGEPKDVSTAAAYARRFELLGSVGSDFHTPENPWIALGRLPPLPAGITPVWSVWEGPATA